MPMAWHKLNYLGLIGDEPAVMIFDADACRELHDLMLWNLIYAFHASHDGKNEDGELAGSGFNPGTRELPPLADARIGGQTARASA